MSHRTNGHSKRSGDYVTETTDITDIFQPIRLMVPIIQVVIYFFKSPAEPTVTHSVAERKIAEMAEMGLRPGPCGQLSYYPTCNYFCYFCHFCGTFKIISRTGYISEIRAIRVPFIIKNSVISAISAGQKKDKNLWGISILWMEESGCVTMFPMPPKEIRTFALSEKHSDEQQLSAQRAAKVQCSRSNVQRIA